MSLVVCNGGKQKLGQYALNLATPEDLNMDLYLTNITPAETDTASTYTAHVASFTGYAQVTLANGSVTSAAPAIASWDDAVFAQSADGSEQLIYGYYVTGDTSSALFWAEKFTTGSPPYSMATEDSSITVSPVLNFASA
jgi:hypothetical protein